MSFCAVSEDRLNLAVQLAKRDVKRKHLEERREVTPKLNISGEFPQLETEFSRHSPEKVKKKQQMQKENRVLKHGPKAEITRSGARVYVYTPEMHNVQSAISDSPPTRDPGPGKRISEPAGSEQEVKRLQIELHSYIQKIQELAQREHSSDVLDADEEARGRIRQQERAARSARMLYVLQQQVKEIQDDLEQLSPQKIRHTKKSRTMSRLAAVHRGAIRALQMFVAQLSERGKRQLPALYKDLGHLIRQLSLCTAKVGANHDPASSELIISILQQVEDLNTLLEQRISLQASEVCPNPAHRSSPIKKEFIAESHDGSTKNERKKYPPPVFRKQSSHAQRLSDTKRQLVVDHPLENVATQTEDPPTPERRAALKSGLEALIQAGGLKGFHRTGAAQGKRKGVLLPQRPQIRRAEASQRTNFQAKTMAFKLKENRPVVRDKKTPWVPPNPTSPPASPKRVHWSKQNKRTATSPPKRLVDAEIPMTTMQEIPEVVGEEAVRLAWLDAETARRMKELTNLYKEEISRIQSLRKQMNPPDQLSTEDAARNCTQAQNNPVYVESLPGNIAVQTMEESNQSGWEQLLEDGSDLENMIKRMEEIEKYQESVRQRFSRIVYADAEFWAQEEKERASASVIDRIPLPPHPMQITKLAVQSDPVVDILLEEPVEGDSLRISKDEMTTSFPHIIHQIPPVWNKGCKPITVPKHTLKNIKDYSEQFQRHLRLTSHEEVGNFNPWQISESLAEELLEEALNEVAAELQEVCEGYAEAVFTSEFLEPNN
ncbi:hypothetical protein GDO86_003101 [Hymenochirus boettgeri]|nr:hypothetical protein GDO86_003101 [Hymenochirus boettgeri]